MSKVLITGHTSGIGKALKEKFEENGHEVIGVSRSTGFDVGKEGDWERLIEEHGMTFDYVILNAGVARFTHKEEEDYSDRIVSTDLMGVYYPLCRLILLMNPNGESVCGVTGSSCAYQSSIDHPLYAAVKTGVDILVKSFTKILAVDGIRIISIAPGFTITNLGNQNYEIPEKLLEGVPLKRAMNPDELAGYYYTILTEFKFANGCQFVIDGGEHA